MIRFHLSTFWICTLLVGTMLVFNACEDEPVEPDEPPVEEVDPNDVRFQLRGGSFGEQNVVFEKTEGTISKTGFDETTGITRLYSLSPKTNSNQNDIIDIYLPYTPTDGTGQYVLNQADKEAKFEDFNVYLGGTKQVSLQTITVEIQEYGEVGGRIKGRFFGQGLDESIGAVQVFINFGEFDMLRTF